MMRTMMNAQTVIKRSSTLKGLVLAATLLLPLHVAAAGSGVELESPIIDTGNHKSLQRGAKTFGGPYQVLYTWSIYYNAFISYK